MASAARCWLQANSVLRLASDGELLCDPLRGQPHVLLLERAPEPVVDDGIDQLGIAQPVAEARLFVSR